MIIFLLIFIIFLMLGGGGFVWFIIGFSSTTIAQTVIELPRIASKIDDSITSKSEKEAKLECIKLEKEINAWYNSLPNFTWVGTSKSTLRNLPVIGKYKRLLKLYNNRNY